MSKNTPRICRLCEQAHAWGDPCKHIVTGVREEERCQRRYGSCALNNGHKGQHNAYVGPWAGSSDGITYDD